MKAVFYGERGCISLRPGAVFLSPVPSFPRAGLRRKQLGNFVKSTSTLRFQQF